jgi:hypothetical protein
MAEFGFDEMTIEQQVVRVRSSHNPSIKPNGLSYSIASHVHMSTSHAIPTNYSHMA